MHLSNLQRHSVAPVDMIRVILVAFGLGHVFEAFAHAQRACLTIPC